MELCAIKLLSLFALLRMEIRESLISGVVIACVCKKKFKVEIWSGSAYVEMVHALVVVME